MMLKKVLLLTSAAMLTACGSPEAEIDRPDADNTLDVATEMMTDTDADTVVMMSQSFPVMNTSGAEIGTVTVSDQSAGGVTVTLDVTAITAGAHAVHFHETGRCDGPDFTSAGGHYNPMGNNHGFDADAPNPHAGDMPNVEAPQSGVVQTVIENERVSLSPREGMAPLFDANGTAFIIHADADDYVSQPTGAAGSRIACAVIAP
ncbi:superoxide dismutase family protein [Algimonas porphyrae]|nr:superoxide dismutase family protein [Algimonas porphyrae]